MNEQSATDFRDQLGGEVVGKQVDGWWYCLDDECVPKKIRFRRAIDLHYHRRRRHIPLAR